jgi:peptidoglycan/LPS O-acetylase OafA/YrhL
MTKAIAIPARFVSLDAMRGGLALLLVVFHFPTIFFGAELPFIRFSYIFTNLFFALSGFVLMAAYGDKLNTAGEYSSFVKRRLFRIYPLYAVTTVFVLLVPYVVHYVNQGLSYALTGSNYGGMPSFPINWSEVAGDALLIQGLGTYDSLHLNFVAWSLSAEFYVALLFGAVMVVAHRFRIVLFALLALAGLYVMGTMSPTYGATTYDFGVFRCLASFFMGALAYELRARCNLEDFMARWGTVVQTSVLMLTFGYEMVVGIGTSATLLAPAVFALWVFVFSFEGSEYSEVLQSKIAEWLSKRSYSLFINQACLLCIGEIAREWTLRFKLDAFTTSVVGTLALILCLGLLVLMSDWTYRNVEQRWAPSRPKQLPAQTPEHLANLSK